MAMDVLTTLRKMTMKMTTRKTTTTKTMTTRMSFCQHVVANPPMVETLMEHWLRKLPCLSPPDAKPPSSIANGGMKDTDQILEAKPSAVLNTTPDEPITTDMPSEQEMFAGRHSNADLPKLDEGSTCGQLEGTLVGHFKGAADDASYITMSRGMAHVAIVD